MGIGYFAGISNQVERDALLVKNCKRLLTREVDSWVTEALKEK
jgi:hypothetical protein